MEYYPKQYRGREISNRRAPCKERPTISRAVGGDYKGDKPCDFRYLPGTRLRKTLLDKTINSSLPFQLDFSLDYKLNKF